MAELKKIIENAPADLEIQKALMKTNAHLNGHNKVLCSISGGADSDIIIDIIEKINGKVDYIFFDTGLEYESTKKHLEYLQKKYGIKIKIAKAVKPIPLCVKQYGVPFLSKQVSEFIERLQRYNFKWEDRPFEELIIEYPKCKASLRWWCNAFEGKGKFNISRNKWLKEFLIAFPPDFPISNKCCHYAKKLVASREKKAGNYDLSITGVRKHEGGARATAYKSCFTPSDEKHDIAEFRPLFWFTNETRKKYEDHYKIIHSECYTKWGFSRTGCAGCPFARDFEKELAAVKQNEPKLYKAMINVFGKSYEYTRKYREFQKKMKEEQKQCTQQ